MIAPIQCNCSTALSQHCSGLLVREAFLTSGAIQEEMWNFIILGVLLKLGTTNFTLVKTCTYFREMAIYIKGIFERFSWYICTSEQHHYQSVEIFFCTMRSTTKYFMILDENLCVLGIITFLKVLTLLLGKRYSATQTLLVILKVTW